MTFLANFANFDPIERPLNINIFQKYFAQFVFGRNWTIWLPGPVEIQKNNFYPQISVTLM